MARLRALTPPTHRAPSAAWLAAELAIIDRLLEDGRWDAARQRAEDASEALPPRPCPRRDGRGGEACPACQAADAAAIELTGRGFAARLGQGPLALPQRERPAVGSD